MIRNLILLLIFNMTIDTTAQTLATLEVEMPVASHGISVPVRTDLDQITFLPDAALVLHEIKAGKKVPVAFQIDQGDQRWLYWTISPDPGQSKKRVFVLEKGTGSKINELDIANDNQALTIRAGDRNLLRYNFGTVYPPEGVDPAYKRSGFIHPLWSPNGQALTRIQPPDHYHHYGIWNPWTHVLYKGDTVDFWNLAGKKGTVRFADFGSVTSGAVFSSFEALHEHVVLKKNGSEEVALNEIQTVRVYQPAQDYYIVDLTFRMNTATSEPVKLLEYRYGGLGWRATAEWNKDNSEVLTSDGKPRKEADGSKARWCIVQGAVGGDYAGVVMMSFPSNYNHPEPLRIWPENQYNRGDMFASFSPTKDKDWLLEPRKNHVLRYRLLVFNGHLSKEKAESAWQYFATPPRVTVTKN
ncbi:MAG TPA: PmoA family protein [Ohtaekwangia sp.]|nr:PmoA family protein [Ohtaekwangia sp.]